MKLKFYLIIGAVILFIGLCTTVGILYSSWKKEKSERQRFENNFDVSQKGSKQWQDKYGKSVSESKAYVLTIAELKKYRAEDARIIKDLKIKHPTSAGTVGTVTTVPFTATVRDSIIHDTLRPCINFQDAYAKIDGCIVGNGKFEGSFSVKDTIKTFGSVIYKKWFIFRCRIFGIESIKQTVISKSPYTKISYSEAIILEKQ